MHSFYGCSEVTESYTKEDLLGKGTFGEVWKATHKSTKAVVALKNILLEKEKEGFPITALREIRILKQLRHENVIALVDMSVTKNPSGRLSFFMVTPYMDHDLAGLIGRRSKGITLSLAVIKSYTQQLLQGIAYLHGEKFLHRDVKTANILIDNFGRVKIADFGLARKYFEPAPTAESGAGPGGRKYTALVVTRWYRAPEIVLGQARYTTAIDIWGVGCVFGEMVLGRPILQGTSDLDQGHKIFKLMGSPTDESMPGWDELPGTNGVQFGPYPRELETVFSQLRPDALSFLAGLLDLNPLTRLTALGALKHEYFTTIPLPLAPSEIPKFPSSHELSVHRGRNPGGDIAPRADPSQHPNYDYSSGSANTTFNSGPSMNPGAFPSRPNYLQDNRRKRGRMPPRHHQDSNIPPYRSRDGRDARDARDRDYDRRHYDPRDSRERDGRVRRDDDSIPPYKRQNTAPAPAPRPPYRRDPPDSLDYGTPDHKRRK